MIKQVGLLPAGCQPWNSYVCAASGDRFAYCATLAIYVYELDKKYNQFRLRSILSEHKKTISALSWNPRNPDIVASAGYDQKIIVWDVQKERPISIYETAKGTATCIDWCLLHGESVSYVIGRGPVFIWNYQSAGATVSSVKESGGFSSDITCFKWHPKKSEKLAFGHRDGTVSFGTLGSKSVRHVLRPDYGDDDDDTVNDPVVCVEWDPLSVDYMLICNTRSGIRLVDSTSCSTITTFHLPSVATQVKSLSWILGAPGMFITGDALSGIIRVWNVSKSSPVENIRVKKLGFHALQVICDNNNRQKQSKYCDSNGVSTGQSSTSMAQAPTKVNSAHFALPPARIVCTFLDGGVGLYDLGRRKWDFLREEGHVETIFDCKFCPFDSKILATGSFDGTIKLWDVSSFTCLNTSPGNEGIIYSISWAPGDLNCIVAGTSKMGVFIWDINKGRIVKRFTEHGSQPVYTVVWSQKDSRKVMSAGADGYCIIRQLDGELLQKYRHPAPVYGCDWSPHNRDMLATGCEDKNVRVYYTATNSDQPLKVFTGHTAKVFHVKWSPLKENLLCSGSDDGSIRVWDYSQEACICTLNGHKGPVRGLIWNSEVPYLIVSGSWDSSIRMWDIREGACVHALADHGADVYGLACHAARPFLLASCSRDSTVRLWSLASLVQPVEINILAGKPWGQILGTNEGVMGPGKGPLLTGRVSKELKQEAEEFPANARTRIIKMFSKFFMAPAGTENLWELVSVLQGYDDTLLSENYKKGIMHVKHIIKYHCSEAQELEMAKMTRFGGGIGSRSKEERLRDAAQLHLKTGNLQRYCELMVGLGEWERALAVSPGVSYLYWKQLTDRYSKYLIQEDKDDTAVFCTAVGNTEMLLDFYTVRGQMSDAVLTAQVACEGLTAKVVTANNKSMTCNGVDEPTEHNKKLLYRTVEEWADWYFSNGSPIHSACCYLAMDHKQNAMCRLIQGNELELAVSMGFVLGDLQQYTSIALEMLSRRCERMGEWELAIDLLHQVSDNQILLAKCCARCGLTKEEIDALHQRAHLPSLADCFIEAEKLKRRNNIFECTMYYLLSTSPELGLELGLQFVKDLMKTSDWTADSIFEMLNLLGCIRTEVLLTHRKKGELLSLCCYIGALEAIKRGYHSIVQPLFQRARIIMQHESYIDIGLTESDMTSQCTAWTSVHNAQPSKPVNTDLIPAEHKPTYMKLMSRVGTRDDTMLYRQDIVSNTHLPSHSDIHLSCLTGERIQGLAYFLEDGSSAVSPNEALMWAKVNPFTPVASGYRMNPF